MILLIGSCSHWDDENPEWNSVKVSPFWFTGQTANLDGFSNTDNIHIFLDYEPFINMEDNSVNFVVTTPVEGKNAYDIDLVSGKRYYQYPYCSQKDVWKEYDREIYLPPFTQGIIPRVLDQLGQPQRIIVFGNDEFFKMDHADFAHRVQIVGAYVEELCHQGNCMMDDSWQKRVVLVGVDPRDRKFSDVLEFSQLKKRINWQEAKAFLENGRGRNFEGAKEFPAIRVIGEIKPGFALRYMLARSHLFQEDELQKIKKTCLKLYDYIWTYAGKMKKKVSAEARMLEKMKKDTNADVLSGVKIKQKFVKETFSQRYVEILTKYGNEALTCFEFVRPNRLRLQPERFWFLTYISAFMKLQRLGYYYNCSRKSWRYNYVMSNGKRKFDPRQELKLCTEKDLNKAFTQLPEFIRQLRLAGREHFRFVEYDNSARGTHAKMYSWVPVGYKKLKCTKTQAKLTRKSPILPLDVEWKKRGLYMSKPKNMQGVIE